MIRVKSKFDWVAGRSCLLDPEAVDFMSTDPADIQHEVQNRGAILGSQAADVHSQYIRPVQEQPTT